MHLLHWKYNGGMVTVCNKYGDLRYFLTAPSHYLNLCWLTVYEIFCQPFQGTVYFNTYDVKPHVCSFEIIATHPWVNVSNDQLFPLLSYFSVVVSMGWLYHNMLSASSYIHICRESSLLCHLLLCSLVLRANNRVHYGPVAVFVCFTSHYLVIIIMQIVELLKCLSGTSVSNVCLEWIQILSILFHAIYVTVCIQLTHFSDDDLIIIIIIKSDAWPTCALFMVWSWNNGICHVSVQ